jgi:hypothetical protein
MRSFLVGLLFFIGVIFLLVSVTLLFPFLLLAGLLLEIMLAVGLVFLFFWLVGKAVIFILKKIFSKHASNYIG